MANNDEHGEAPAAPTPQRRHGGWTTTPFIIASLGGLTLAVGSWMNNLIVFLIREFNIKTIDAAQISNVVLGCSNFFPLIAAILADSFLGSFSVIWTSSLFSLLGQILLVLTVTVSGFNCETETCATPSKFQYALLFTALALLSIGSGGTRFTLATMGANQFTRLDHQSTYFNWYFLALYFASFISATAIVYVEDNLSWGWGLGIGVAANVLGLAAFLGGSRYYYYDRPRGSPFTGLLGVIVACFRKRKEALSYQSTDYYYGDGDDDDGAKEVVAEAPTNSFRVLNRAALKTEADILPNGSIAKNRWRLSTVQQVEDLKSVIRILPLWSSSILLSTPIGIQLSLTILQALTTNRHLGHHFQVPAASMLVFALLSAAICLTLLDHCLWPLSRKVLAGTNLTSSLQQVGIGHVLNIAAMAVSALVESRRRRAHRMSVLWLVPQMVIVGIGEAFHFPGQVTLYYQEFPGCLKSMATAMIAMLIGVGFYLSSGVIDFIRRVTMWLPDNIDDGRVDNVYWVLVVIGVINFGYFLVCCWFYEYKKAVEVGNNERGVGEE